jgi:hypothetical protein
MTRLHKADALNFQEEKKFFMALDKNRSAMVHTQVVCLVAHGPRGRVDVVAAMVEAGARGEGASRRHVGAVPVVPTAAQQLVLLGAAASALASLACCGRWGREGLGGRRAAAAVVLAAAAAASPPSSLRAATAAVRSSLATSRRRCGPPSWSATFSRLAGLEPNHSPQMFLIFLLDPRRGVQPEPVVD